MALNEWALNRISGLPIFPACPVPLLVRALPPTHPSQVSERRGEGRHEETSEQVSCDLAGGKVICKILGDLDS